MLELRPNCECCDRDLAADLIGLTFGDVDYHLGKFSDTLLAA